MKTMKIYGDSPRNDLLKIQDQQNHPWKTAYSHSGAQRQPGQRQTVQFNKSCGFCLKLKERPLKTVGQQRSQKKCRFLIRFWGLPVFPLESKKRMSTPRPGVVAWAVRNRWLLKFTSHSYYPYLVKKPYRAKYIWRI